jgi:SH3-like domain-containing protein
MNLPFFILPALLAAILSFAVQAQQSNPRVLTVKADYVDLHRNTDAAQKFYALEKGEQLQVLARRAGFLQVETLAGINGWLAEQDISALTTPEGQEVSLNNSSLLDYFKIKGVHRQ